MKFKTVNLIIPAQEWLRGTVLVEINLGWTEQIKPLQYVQILILLYSALAEF